MKILKKILRKEDGQSLVLFALFMLVLLGFAALVIDAGVLFSTRSQLQNAADAAALAGARDLPSISAAKTSAIYYAGQNGVEGSNTIVTTPYKSDTKKIEVICSKSVTYSFARFLGFTSGNVSARAVAQKNSQWTGEALPFINLDDDYSTNPEIVAWEKVTPGDFESINNYTIVNPSSPSTLYFTIDYTKGVVLKKGTVATIKQEVGYVYDQHKPDKLVYVLSLNKTVMSSGKVLLTNGTYASLSKLKNGDTVATSQLVLLECIFHDYDYQGKTLYLTTKNVYDIGHGVFPPNYINPAGGSVLLVE